MASLSTRLGLSIPATSDSFLTSDYVSNLGILNNYPGYFICTSGSRPSTWGAANSGQRIWETDTGLAWRWSGTAFVRAMPLGYLGLSSISADFPTAATTATTAITTAVTVPATDAGSTTKRIKITGSWYALDNGTTTTLGLCEVSIYRDPGTVLIKSMQWRGRPLSTATPLDCGAGGTIVGLDAPTAGATTYYLRINSIAAVGGTTTLRATATARAELLVEEIGA